MCRIGVAVKEFDLMIRAGHECVMDFLRDDGAAHRNRAVGDTLRKRDDIRRHAVALSGKGKSQPPERRDHFIENEQDAVAVADFPQALQIAGRRSEDTGRP